MNNFKNIFRVHHKNSFMTGPYSYLAHKKSLGIEFDDTDIEFRDMLLCKERFSNEHKKYYKCFDKLQNFDIFNKYGAPATYKARRPGPFDDPLLKDNLRKIGIDREYMNTHFPVKYYGFDSLDQLYKWFNHEEINELKEFDFIISKIQEPLNKIVFGLSQLIVLK